MKICTHCKVENNDSANFCRRCGFVFPGVKAQGGLTDVSLVDKINDLQSKVIDSERKCESAKKEAESLRSQVASMSAGRISAQRKLADFQKQISLLQGSLNKEQQKTRDVQAQEYVARKKVEKLMSSRIWLHLVYIILTVSVGMFGFVEYTESEEFEDKWRTRGAKLCDLRDSLKDMKNIENVLRSENYSLSKRNSTMSSILDKISLRTPLFVGDVYIKNNGESYGSAIYSNNTTYINPKVEIFSLIDGRVNIYYKLYSPNGLSTGSTSPNGYSSSDYFYVNKNENNICEFMGWGNSRKGYWPPGAYRYEFYYNGKCIGSKSFTIY